MEIQMVLILLSILLLAGCGGAATNDLLMQRAAAAQLKADNKAFKLQEGQWDNAIVLTSVQEPVVK